MDSQCGKNTLSVVPMGPVPVVQECHILTQPRDVFGVGECKGQESEPDLNASAVPEDIHFLETQQPSELSTTEIQLIPLIDDFLQRNDVPDVLTTLLFQEIERNAARLKQADSIGDAFDAKRPECLHRFTSKQLQQKRMC